MADLSRRTGGLCSRNFLLWGIPHYKFVRNFPHNFQAAVRNKLVLKFSKKLLVVFADGVQMNSMGMKPLAIDSSFCCTVVHFVHTLCSFLPSMLCFFEAQAQDG